MYFHEHSPWRAVYRITNDGKDFAEEGEDMVDDLIRCLVLQKMEPEEELGYSQSVVSKQEETFAIGL